MGRKRIVKEVEIKRTAKYVLTRQEEKLIDRLEYCRAFLYTNNMIGESWNVALKRKFEKYRKEMRKTEKNEKS